MPWVSERTMEALAVLMPRIAAQNTRIERLLEKIHREQTERNVKMDEELKALADAIAEDRNANNSARRLIEDLAAKIDTITATIPANFRNQLVALTTELRANSADLAGAVVKNTPAEAQPVPAPTPVEPAPPAPEQPPAA